MTGRRDDGNMGLAMLVTIVSLGLSAVLASIVASSITSTRADVQTLRAVDAAHAGLNVGLVRVMKLGVAPLGPSDCLIEGDSSSGHYRVLIGFYAAPPDPAVDPVAADCAFNPATRRYAQVVAVGSDGNGGAVRTLTATYAFPVGSANRATGGNLVIPAAGGDTCLTTALTLAACDPGATAQSFVYGSDLTLSQIDVATLRANCVQAGASALSMQLCDPADTTQKWYFNGRTFLTAGGTACLDVLGSSAVLGTGSRCTAGTGTTPTWRPDPQVGAGWAADTASKQIVNGDGFARCLTTAATLAVCGQNSGTPGSTGPWVLTTVAGTSYVTISTGASCLSTVAMSAVPTIAACVSGNTSQRWTAPAVADSWETSFRITAANGMCLAAVPSATDPYAGTLTTATCDDSTAQKWNVDWNAFRSGLMKVGER